MEEYLNKHYREYFRGKESRLKSINNCYYQAEDQRTISHEELFKIYWDRFPKYEAPFQALLSATSKAPPGIKKFRGDYKKRSIKALYLAQSSAFTGNYSREFKLKTMKRSSIESIESRMRNFQYFHTKQVCTCRKFNGNSVKYSHTLQVSNESQNTNISNCINSWGKSAENSLESDNTTSLFTKIVSKPLSYNHINCEGPKWGKSENSKNLTNNPNLTTIMESHCETEELKDKLYFDKITANKLCGTLNDNSESACSFDHSTNISDLQSHLSPSIQDTSILYKSIDYSTATIFPLESSNHSILYSDLNCNSDQLANNLKKKVEQQIHMQLPLHGRINISNENFSNYLNSVKRIPFVFPPPIKNKILSKQVLPSLNCEISTLVFDKLREETQDKKTMIEQLKPEIAIKKCEIRNDQYDQILDNPIPFKSDLLSARWNRRIRTTIPYSQNKGMDKQVWSSMNNPFENFLNTENEYTRVNLDIEGVSRNPIIVNNPEICEVPPSLLHFKQESSDILDNSVKLRINEKSKYIEPLPIQPNTDQYDNKHKLKSHIITPLDPLNLQGLIKEDNHEEVKNIDTVKIMTDLDIPDKRDNNETGYNYFETPEDTQIAAENICYKKILPVKNNISQESSNIRITVDYSSEESTLGAQENSPKILGAEPNLIMDPGNNYNKDIISRNCMTNLRGFGKFNSALLVSKYIDSLDKLECIHCIICENKIGGFDMESNSKYHGDTSVWRLSRYFIKKIDERWRNRKRIYISQFLISLIFLLFSLILLPLITYSNFYLSNSLIFVVYIITIPLCVFGGLFGTFLGFYFLDNLKDFKELAYSVKIDLINEVKRIKNELCENDISEKNLDCELSSIPIEDVYYPSLPNEMLDHLFESLFNYFNDEQSLFGGNTTKISDMTSKILQIEKDNINIFLYTGTSIYFFNIIINITLWILDTNHNYSLLLFGSICFILVSVISWLIILYKFLWKGSKFHIGLPLFSAVFRPLLLSPKSCAEALKLRVQLILSVVLIFTCGSIDHIKRKKETKFNILNIPLQHIKGILAMNCQPLQKINRYILTRLRLRLNKFDSKFLNSNNIVLSSIFTSSLWPFTYISFSSSDILITSFNFSNCKTTQKDLSKENYILSVPLNAMSVQCVMASSSASELLDYFNPNESSIDFESNLLYFLNNPLFTTSPKVYEDNFASIVSTVRNLAINYTEDGLTGDDLLESYFEEAKRDEYVYLVYCNFPVEYCFWHQVQNIFSPCTSDEYVTVAFILYNIEDVLVLYRHIS
ncbi:uncharacterized protein CMU_010680 [Cryptosporidium muris RN66]|uniref:Transmembrane protein n=1 Tax=Cryptosporidium muris (strain RN66) TaxID=441375 RepID=B6AIS9_CRYMR|nr:uncharacterized protein CMU_010680 [Cryptosporidium muris RN66]EEA08120.1 hypothetical protein CMU_010680 [Cryptosporidium muris RN66]|eukprot:XP_002142469.1 hypothetical protein [Cryptosporidium muris RN66]